MFPVISIAAAPARDVAQAGSRFPGLRLQVEAADLTDARQQGYRSGCCGIGDGRQVIGGAIRRF